MMSLNTSTKQQTVKQHQETVKPTTTTEISQGEMFPQQPKVHRKTVT